MYINELFPTSYLQLGILLYTYITFHRYNSGILLQKYNITNVSITTKISNI